MWICLPAMVMVASVVLAACSSGSPLTVVLEGNGVGAVTSTPPGIDCGMTCEAFFEPGTVVELVANTANGSFLEDWRGCDQFTGDRCRVTVDGPTTLRAVFGAEGSPDRTLALAFTGTGAGVVRYDEGPWQCTSSCTSPVADVGTMELSAYATIASRFDGWTGECADAGTSPRCTIALGSAPHSVGVRFVTTSQPQLAPIPSAQSPTCSAVGAGTDCFVSVRLTGLTDSIRGLEFDLVLAGLSVRGVEASRGADGCLASAGPATVILVCPSDQAFSNGTVLELALTRLTDEAILVAVTDASVAKDPSASLVPVLGAALPGDAR